MTGRIKKEVGLIRNIYLEREKTSRLEQIVKLAWVRCTKSTGPMHISSRIKILLNMLSQTMKPVLLRLDAPNAIYSKLVKSYLDLH